MNDTTVVDHTTTLDTTKPAWLDRVCQRILHRLLSRVTTGTVVLVDGERRDTFGPPRGKTNLHAEIHVHDPRFYRCVVGRGNLGAGEAFMDAYWSCDDVVALIRIIVRQSDVMNATDRGWARLKRPMLSLVHYLRKNTLAGSRRNISEHYDLGNDFYSQFLDETMSYSCAYFDNEETTLEAASIAKIDRICRKLELKPGDHLLEIGTGWGALAIHAARHYGCHVTTTTISRQQFELASQRIKEAQLEDQITLLFKDYRMLEGQFDKCVSVEMIEAVGHHFYDSFFHKCCELLKPDGVMLIQAITIRDQVYEKAKHNVDFIKRYIFPGSCIPSVERMMRSIANVTDFRMLHLEDITPHYAITLQHWRKNFLANRDAIENGGASDRFMRMWEYYLCYCEGGFAERYIGDVQLLIARAGSLHQTHPTNWMENSMGAKR